MARGIDANAPRLFIVDDPKASSKAIRRTFGRAGFIQRRQTRNFIERLPKTIQAQDRYTLCQA